MTAFCDVYFVPLSGVPRGYLSLLDESERWRWSRLQRTADRDRFVLATVLLKSVAASHLARPYTEIIVDRSCDRCGLPHGRPRIIGSGLEFSVSHSGQLVAAALTDAGPVGIDLEEVRPLDYRPMLSDVCTLEEQEFVHSTQNFYTYWTRKEAVLKATGEGLSLSMLQIAVTPPNDSAKLLTYRGAPLAAMMKDLSPTDGYVGAVVVLTEKRTNFAIHHKEMPLSLCGGWV